LFIGRWVAERVPMGFERDYSMTALLDETMPIQFGDFLYFAMR